MIVPMRIDLLSRYMSNVDTSADCWIWTGSKNPAGYGMTWHNTRGKKLGAHRVMYMIFNGEIGTETQVLHSCDNPSCVKPTHLSAGTISDNMSDMANKRRGNTVKLTHDQVSYIRSTYVKRAKTGPGAAGNLAREFGVHRSTIRQVAIGGTWKLS